MSQTFLVTQLQGKQNSYQVCALYQDQHIMELSGTAQSEETTAALGDIYVGRVKDVVKNLNAAFIEIAPGVPCYYPLEEFKNPIFVKKIPSPRLVQGDELLVQVEKEAMKTKPPKVTTNLNFQGRFLALTTGNPVLGFSKKLNKHQRLKWRDLLEEARSSEFGVIVRTNSQTASREQLLEELLSLEETARSLIQKAPHLTCFAKVSETEPHFIRRLRGIDSQKLTDIVTDDPKVYDLLETYLREQQPQDLAKLRLYQDDLQSLSKCYSLEVRLKEALNPRVWLKSGGYLVIEPTEALTVIDVNSGKSSGGKKPQEHYLKVNLEAAQEIARQLRLRNISGIILVDFIDLADPQYKTSLLGTLTAAVAQDPVPVQVIDMTKLNLIEMTRKKVQKSLREQFSDL